MDRIIYRSGKSYELSVADYLTKVGEGGNVPREGQVVEIKTTKKRELVPDKIVDLEKLKDLQRKDELIVRWKDRIVNRGHDCGKTERKELKLINRIAIDRGKIASNYSVGWEKEQAETF